MSRLHQWAARGACHSFSRADAPQPRRRARAAGVWLVAVAAMVLAPVSGPTLTGQSRPQVTHRARALEPGEVVRIIVDASGGAHRLSGAFRDQQLRFYESDDPGRWEALVGLDLDLPPGEYPVRIVLHDTNAGPREVSYTLPVQAKEFPTRRLTVAPDFVNPPKSVLARIERESRAVRQALATITPERHWRGPFVVPVPGAATSSFGKRSILNGEARSPHSGADFRGATGTPVKAPAAGRVALAAEQYYSGNLVIIDHGLGMHSMLAHLSRIDVAPGQTVQPGDVVGAVGATGRVTGPHLHWALRLQGARVDPLSLVAALE